MHAFLAAADAHALAQHWETPGVIGLKLLVVLLLVLLNGFFVASEFAIVKVRGSHLATIAKAGDPRAAFAHHLTTHLDAYLSATQLGITLASLGLGWIGEPFLAKMLEPLFFRAGITSPAVIGSSSFAIAFATITTLHIVLGELAPKSLAIRKPAPVTLWISRPLHLFYEVFRPAIWMLNGAANFTLKHLFRLEPVNESELAHSEEELRHLLGESADAGQGSRFGKDVAMRALSSTNRVVREIMTPRGRVVFLETDNTFQENRAIAQKSRHTRFPLCDRHLDNALGLVHIKDLWLAPEGTEPDLMKVKRELASVPEMMPLDRLIAFFKTQRTHLALVLDEFGGAVGIVTLEDAVSELVGDMGDEFDASAPATVRWLNEREFVVPGEAALHDLQDQARLELAGAREADVTTIGGYVTHLLGHLPVRGETIRMDGYLATVAQADNRRILQLHFRRV
jgi:CBS domain containing-hemolysin-like protein